MPTTSKPLDALRTPFDRAKTHCFEAAGLVRQAAGGRRQAAGGRRQAAGGRRQAAGDGMEVVNIVPLEVGEFCYRAYNTILEDVATRVVAPAAR